MRAGIGYDIHRLAEGRRLVLGGVEIPSVVGLDGHSDADVLLHAIIDALLGAIGAPDVGEQFPSTDPAYANISSLTLLERVRALVTQRGFAVQNVDATIVAESPALSPFKAAMVSKIQSALQLQDGQVSVKAKTNEMLDGVGRREGIAAYAVAVVEERPKR